MNWCIFFFLSLFVQRLASQQPVATCAQQALCLKWTFKECDQNGKRQACVSWHPGTGAPDSCQLMAWWAIRHMCPVDPSTATHSPHRWWMAGFEQCYEVQGTFTTPLLAPAKSYPLQMGRGREG